MKSADDVFFVAVQFAGSLRSLFGGRRNFRNKIFSHSPTTVSRLSGDLADAQSFVE